jgi:hypothetical protein
MYLSKSPEIDHLAFAQPVLGDTALPKQPARSGLYDLEPAIGFEPMTC